MAPSVFTANDEKVIRRVQVDEPLDVYDVEILTQKELGNYWRLGHCSPSFAFARAAPLKVGIEAARLFFGKLRENDALSGQPCLNDLAQSRKRQVSEQGKEDQLKLIESSHDHSPTGSSIKRAKRESTLVTDGRLKAGIDGGQIKVEHLTASQTGPSVKATKSDDAEVNERQWDEWSVDSFASVGEESAKVCVAGTYSSKLHGRFFRGLRSLALRWYRKRILRSFLSYLNDQYGGGGSYYETIPLNGRSVTISLPNWIRSRYQMKAVDRSRKRRPRLAASSKELCKDLLVGREAVWRASQSSWWNWECGSTIYFWRWSPCHRAAV